MSTPRTSKTTLGLADWKDGRRCAVSVRREAWRWPALLAIRSRSALASVAGADESPAQVHVLEPGRYLLVLDDPDALDRRVRRLEVLGQRRLATSQLDIAGALVAADRAQLAALEPGARAVPTPVALAALAGWLLPGRAVEIQYHDAPHRITCQARAGRLAAPTELPSARDIVMEITAGATHVASSITLRRGEASITPSSEVARAIRALTQLTPRELLAVGGALGALAPGSFPEIPLREHSSFNARSRRGPLVASVVLLVTSGLYWIHSARALAQARANAREIQVRIDAFASRGVSHR